MCVCILCLCNAVRLEWKPSDESDVLYAASINVYCTDRKYLLSDVSIVVSRETMIQVTHHYSSIHMYIHTLLSIQTITEILCCVLASVEQSLYVVVL
jgi:(p)ppGpp synthase/HD superfamily hydrolase